jgi:hypothetical protein
VGINLHEKLSSEISPLRDLFVKVIRLGPSGAGKNVFSGCVTLLGNVMADDPTIISTFADCGIVEALGIAANNFAEKNSSEVLSALFVAICALNLHDSGTAKLKEIGDPLGTLLEGIAGDKFDCWSAWNARRNNHLQPPSMAMNDENRIVEDVGIVAGQSCDDLLRNKPAMKDKLMEAFVRGIEKISTCEEVVDEFSKKIIPGLRILYGGLISSTELVESFVAHKGMERLCDLIGHPKMEPGALLLTTSGSNNNRPHPMVSVWKSVGQRCGRPNSALWQIPLANLLSKSITSSQGDQFLSAIGSICLLFNSAFQQVPLIFQVAPQASAENTSGALLFIAKQVTVNLPQLYKSYTDAKGTCSWAGAAWVAIKNCISTLSVFANTTAVTSSGKAVSLMIVSGLIALSQSSTGDDSMTELADLLTRCFIEDKNHSIRPLLVHAFWCSKGFDIIVNLFKQDSFLPDRETSWL